MIEQEMIHGEGGGGGCFPAGTKINTPTGYRLIEDLVIDDEVYAFDISSDEPGEVSMPGVVFVKKVTAVFKHSYDEVGYQSPLLIITHEKGEFKVTGNHYILTPSRQTKDADQGFALASELQIGDILFTEYGEETLITDIQVGEEYDFVYNFEVEELHAYVASKIRVHNGGGGGKGGGSAHIATQAPNSIRTNQIARVINLVSEGETKGPWVSGDPAQSIFFDNTPLKNADASYNYTNVVVGYRVGLPSQAVIPGFSSVEAETVAGNIVSVAAPVVKTILSGVDGARITIKFTNGLQSIDASSGDANGTSVNFTISTRVTSGTWVVVVNDTVSQMSSGPFEVAYRVNNPGTGSWEFKVTRITADSSSNYLINQFQVSSYTNITDVALPYNDRAYYSVTAGANSTNNQIPAMSADWGGILCSVPNNYNASTRVYTGSWSGSFASTKVWTDNPAWLLLEFMKNARYGIGNYIDVTQIDVFSFYTAAIYCDQLIDDGKGTGTFEPRFTFNAQIMVRDDAWKTLQAIASSFRSMLYIHNGYIRLVQDRPTQYTRILGNSQVVAGLFTYSGSQGRTRYTACNATYSDINNNCLPTAVTEKSTSGNILRYGYTATDIVSYGATTEGQARRDARWLVDTSINNTEFVEFQVGPQYADFEPGEVFHVMDTDYAQVTQEGRLVSVAGGVTLTLDAPLIIGSGTWTIDCVSSDGDTIETRTITTGAGVYSTITVSGAITGGAGTPFIIAGAISPRSFKCLSMTETLPMVYTIRGVQYDSTKFARIETGVSIPISVFYSQPNRTIVTIPTSLVFSVQSSTNPNGTTTRYIAAAWLPPADKTAVGYQIAWVKDNSVPINQSAVIPFTRIEAPMSGVYTIYINAINAGGVGSPTLSGSYTLNLDPASGSGINAPTALAIVGGSTIWNNETMSFSWTPPTATPGFTLQDYLVELQVVSGPVFRSFYTTETSFDYTYTMNSNDVGGPRNVIQVNVYSRDTFNKFGSPMSATFTNPSPVAVTSLATIGSFKTSIVSWGKNAEPDVVGYLIWRSTSSGFTPSSGNLINDTPNISYVDAGLPDSATYYYKVAAYDIFSRNVTGAGLNVVQSGAVTTLDPNNTNEYQLSGVIWTPNSPAANSVAWSACTAIKTAGTSLGSTWAITAGNTAWTSGILYIYYTEGETILRSTTTITTAIANNKIIVATYRGGTNFEKGNGQAYMDGSFVIAGTVGAAQLVTGTAVITQSAQIATAIITNAMISDATIDTLKLKNGSISDTRFYVDNTSTSIVTTSSAGTFNITEAVAAEFLVTAPSPSGLSGPFSTFISTTLSTSTRINGSITVGGGVSGLSTTNTASIAVDGQPTWYIRVVRVSNNSVIASTTPVQNGSGVKLGSITVGGGVSGISTTNTANIIVNGGGGLNMQNLIANLLPGVQYKIQIIVGGALYVPYNSTSTPISITVDQRSIYSQCILR